MACSSGSGRTLQPDRSIFRSKSIALQGLVFTPPLSQSTILAICCAIARPTFAGTNSAPITSTRCESLRQVPMAAHDLTWRYAAPCIAEGSTSIFESDDWCTSSYKTLTVPKHLFCAATRRLSRRCTRGGSTPSFFDANGRGHFYAAKECIDTTRELR